MTPSKNRYLDWPEESCGEATQYPQWVHAGSNICLDFHGDPARSQLVVFSDGNHHMALQETLTLFRELHPEVSDIFYATTPPGPIINLLKQNGLKVGNLLIRVAPHIFISPPEILDKLVENGYMKAHFPFVQNQGSVLLIKKGNPKGIAGVQDLVREDVRLFISNPITEKASFSIYHHTLTGLISDFTGDSDLLHIKEAQGQVQYGTVIHHREAPQAVADGSADVAVVFYHLALRYRRIFPEIFEAIPLGGSMERPETSDKNIVANTHAGLVKGGGKWGKKFLAFIRTNPVKEIYAYHGLRPL